MLVGVFCEFSGVTTPFKTVPCNDVHSSIWKVAKKCLFICCRFPLIYRLHSHLQMYVGVSSPLRQLPNHTSRILTFEKRLSRWYKIIVPKKKKNIHTNKIWFTYHNRVRRFSPLAVSDRAAMTNCTTWTAKIIEIKRAQTFLANLVFI